MVRNIPIIIVMLMVNGFSVQQKESQKNEKLKLIHADSLVVRDINNEEVTSLFGDVRLVQGDAELQCQRGRLYRNKRFAVLEIQVQIFDGQHTLWADKVEYNGEKSIETATGNVKIKTDHRVLTADKVVYNQNEKVTSAFGSVVIQDLVEQVVLYGDEAFYDKPRDYAYLKGTPHAVRTDSATGEEINIDGLRIDAWGEQDKIMITDSVKITKADLHARCGKSIFLARKDTLLLMDSPVVQQKKHRMEGDSIDICIKNMNFNGGILRGRAEIISQQSTTQDELRGKRIDIIAENDTIKEVQVTGQATSVYYIQEENERGKNLLTGDQINLIFTNDSLKKVNVFSDPGLCTGEYTPEKNKIKGEKK